MTFQAYFWNFSINFFTILSVMPGQAASATAILFSSSSIAWFLLALFSSCCLSWERSIAITFKITKLLELDSQSWWVCTYFSKCRCDYHRQTAQGLYKILLLWTNIIDYTHEINHNDYFQLPQPYPWGWGTGWPAQLHPLPGKAPLFPGSPFPCLPYLASSTGLAARIWGTLIDAWGLFPF